MVKRSETKKTYVGSRIRTLRRDHDLTQAALAQKLGISPSYLNLIEHNQRAVTVPLLLGLSEVLGVNLNEIAEDEGLELVGDLQAIVADALFDQVSMPIVELKELSLLSPAMCRVVRDLYRSYRANEETISALVERLAVHGDRLARTDDPISALPYEEVNDFIQSSQNHFAELEEEAEALWQRASLKTIDMQSRLVGYLEAAHRIQVRIESPKDMQGMMRQLDSKRRALRISELLPLPSRTFQIAHQIGILELRPLLDEILSRRNFIDASSRELCRIALANYFAGAVMMPYEPCLETAENARYDLDVLENRFAASFEQVCHRLTSLGRPEAPGVPFHLVRADIAGNISKRFSASGIRIARYSAGCPLWNVHRAFMAPNRIRVQLSVMPDGKQYICVARAVRKLGGGFRNGQSYLSIGIGCEDRHASRLVYADLINFDDPENAVPIGVNCRSCERLSCPQRAFPSASQSISANANSRSYGVFVTPDV